MNRKQLSLVCFVVPIGTMVNDALHQFFFKNYVKRIVSLTVQGLFCSWFESAPGLRVFCANANPIKNTPKEQTGAKSIVYSAGTVTRS